MLVRPGERVSVDGTVLSGETSVDQAAITGQVGRPVTLQIVIDQSVLGGARVQVGDEVIEGTVAARLAAAEKQLTQK